MCLHSPVCIMVFCKQCAVQEWIVIRWVIIEVRNIQYPYSKPTLPHRLLHAFHGFPFQKVCQIPDDFLLLQSLPKVQHTILSTVIPRNLFRRLFNIFHILWNRAQRGRLFPVLSICSALNPVGSGFPVSVVSISVSYYFLESVSSFLDNWEYICRRLNPELWTFSGTNPEYDP